MIAGNTYLIGMIPIDEDFLKHLQKPKLLPTENSIVTLYNTNNIQTQTLFKLIKGNIEIALFTIQSQSIHSRTQKWKYSKWSEQTRE